MSTVEKIMVAAGVWLVFLGGAQYGDNNAQDRAVAHCYKSFEDQPLLEVRKFCAKVVLGKDAI